MAVRRMFSKTILDSDSFLDLPLSSQALYLHLGVQADDDGLLGNTRKIQHAVGCTDDDLLALVAKGYLIPFDSGVYAIVHWHIHNQIRKDRYSQTMYQEEIAHLQLTANKSYIWTPYGCQMDDHRDTQGSGGQDSAGQFKGEYVTEEREQSKGTHSVYGEHSWIELSDTEYEELLEEMGKSELERCIVYIDQRAQLTGNRNGWKDWCLLIQKCHREKWGVTNSKEYEKKSAGSFADLADEIGAKK